ncbi:TPA: restriction endonuclease [Streptococcus suis]|nr:restriction endonuclease [Streptococcus suis]NQI92732.1 restriction endonuclease [Streptococcus suis]NQJ00581.1 restriction endonuclease [Streptococcus suis]HEM4248691.1 restriction endonuclease [Streptococcus suis]
MNYLDNIKNSTKSIYDVIEKTDTNLYIPTSELQTILNNSLVGISLEGLALRTRSKQVKSLICEALGYPIPKSFKKTQPRFPGQNFDVYTQKSLNVQIWNEEVDASRRYVFIQINDKDVITAVKIITGEELVTYDKTGTLTRKYQATMNHLKRNYCSTIDTDNINSIVTPIAKINFDERPNSLPTPNNLLRIDEIFNRLLPLVGSEINYINATQERNRGAELHSKICSKLGYKSFEDDGSYPDIKNQLLEVKLQTSPTIDLGLHSPEDGELVLTSAGHHFYSKDVRYAIFDAEVIEDKVRLNNLYVLTGAEFTSFFPLFKGRGTNAKIQLPLPQDFFSH